jgi:hypothetical protein
MSGTMTVTESRNLRIHTFTAPDDGWSVNSHIIELPTQLIILDAQYGEDPGGVIPPKLGT